MKFGKRLKKQVEESLPEWRDKFLAYKRLKRLVRLVSASGSSPRRHRGSAAEAAFLRLLDAEVDRFNAFFLEREEDFVIRHRARSTFSFCLHSDPHSIRVRGVNASAHRCECDVRLRDLIVACAAQELKEMAKKVAEDALRRRPLSAAETRSVRKEIVDLHGEMVLLLNYSAINYTGCFLVPTTSTCQLCIICPVPLSVSMSSSVLLCFWREMAQTYICLPLGATASVYWGSFDSNSEPPSLFFLWNGLC